MSTTHLSECGEDGFNLGSFGEPFTSNSMLRLHARHETAELLLTSPAVGRRLYTGSNDRIAFEPPRAACICSHEADVFNA
jgi:hypothetical protein